jgi:hypothetical protein
VGFLLFCVEARLRVADGMKVLQEPTLDVNFKGEGYVEGKCGALKSTRTKQRRGKALHIVGHSLDFKGREWARTWLQLREEDGLDAARDACLQPQPMAGGGWGRSRMISSELGIFIRTILDQTLSTPAGQDHCA